MFIFMLLHACTIYSGLKDLKKKARAIMYEYYRIMRKTQRKSASYRCLGNMYNKRPKMKYTIALNLYNKIGKILATLTPNISERSGNNGKH